MAPRQHEPSPAYVAAAQPPVVILPSQRQSNGWGVFGFLVALIGLFIPTGIVAVLGLMICLIAAGRSPRGFAVVGVLIGLLGTIVWAIIDIAALLAIAIGMTLFGSAAFTMSQPEVVDVTSDMANIVMAAEQHDHDNGSFSLDDLELSIAQRTDPWGTAYVAFNTDNDLGFELVSAGPDQTFETEDDILLSRLDQYWENAMERFGPQLEAFTSRIHELESRYGGSCDQWSCDINVRAPREQYQEATADERPRTRSEQYEQKAREAESHAAPVPDKDAA